MYFLEILTLDAYKKLLEMRLKTIEKFLLLILQSINQIHFPIRKYADEENLSTSPALKHDDRYTKKINKKKNTQHYKISTIIAPHRI